VKIAIGSDHAGFELKGKVRRHLEAAGHDVEDMGVDSDQAADYPVYAHRVGKAVAQGHADRGVVMCGSGMGVCIAANKVHGVRATLAWNEENAHLARAHNDSNVLCLGGRTMDQELALRVLDVWLETPFEGGRHARRVRMLEETD
jgi:ribose 5-phosphate isomerase B